MTDDRQTRGEPPDPDEVRRRKEEMRDRFPAASPANLRDLASDFKGATREALLQLADEKEGGIPATPEVVDTPDNKYYGVGLPTRSTGEGETQASVVEPKVAKNHPPQLSQEELETIRGKLERQFAGSSFDDVRKALDAEQRLQVRGILHAMAATGVAP